MLNAEGGNKKLETMQKELQQLRGELKELLMAIVNDTTPEGDTTMEREEKTYLKFEALTGWEWEYDDHASEYFLKCDSEEICRYYLYRILPRFLTFGVHSPAMTTENVRKLAENWLEVEDISHCHDMCDSITVNVLNVFLPNAKKVECEVSDFTHFYAVPTKSDESFDHDNGKNFNTIEELIEFLNENK